MNEIYLIKKETLNNIAAVTRQKMGAAAEEKIRITELAQKIENIPTINITQTPVLIEFANANIFNSSHYDDYDENASFGEGKSTIEKPLDFNPTLLNNTQYIIQLGQLNQNIPLTSCSGEIQNNKVYNTVSAVCIYGEHFITNKPIMFFLQYFETKNEFPEIQCYGYGKDGKSFGYEYKQQVLKDGTKIWNWITSSGEGKVNIDVINGKYKNVKIIDWTSMAPTGALENLASNINYTTSLELLQSFKIIDSPLYEVYPWDFSSETE